MDPDELTHLLDAVAAGALSTADAELRIRTQPYVDAGGFAKVDLHRRVRCGFPEVIFGQGKTAQQIEAILRALITHGQGGLVTRVEPAAAAHLRSAFPEGQHNPVGRTFRIESPEAAGQGGAGGRRHGGDERPARGRGGSQALGSQALGSDR